MDKKESPRGEHPPLTPSRLPLPAFLAAWDGSILSWNGPFEELLEMPPSIRAPHLVRQELLERPYLYLAEIRRKAERGGSLRLRMRTLSGRPLDLLAHVSTGPGEGGKAPFLALLLDARPWAETEAALRAEIHHLEDLLEETAGENGRREALWKDAARGLLQAFPARAVLLDRRLEVLLPTQGEGGPPVLCTKHLLGSPGTCPECLAAKALEEGREVRALLEGRELRARPLPGGLVLEWVEEEGGEGRG